MYPEIKDYAFSFDELKIFPDQIEEVMGYTCGQSPEPFPEMIRSALLRGPELCDIKGSVVVSEHFKVDEKAGFFSFEDTLFYADNKMLSQLSSSGGAVVFICTAGPLIGKMSQEIMGRGDFMEGYILDLLGSVTVEAALEKIQNILIAELEGKGLKITNRYSPGYCGWPLTEQKKLFSLFPPGHCSIALTKSCLMEPTKSISGIIGFGAHAKKHLHECELCELETCMYRTIRLARQK